VWCEAAEGINLRGIPVQPIELLADVSALPSAVAETLAELPISGQSLGLLSGLGTLPSHAVFLF